MLLFENPPPQFDSVGTGCEVAHRTQGDGGRGFCLHLASMNVPTSVSIAIAKNRNIYYEVNVYVNTLKTKSTRGQEIANQNLFIAEIFKMFLMIEICCYIYFYLTNYG